ncbi:MAG: 1-deoxy-D-xylulose-5-phosphate reductoisomerase [bacterium]|nr:MAG: 1-deoxy-D-xylulose-5-phosphate reductoisomerase [bacterium]
MTTRKRISILGSTGSIGLSTLDIVARRAGDLEVVALASRSDFRGILDQARRFRPKVVALFDDQAAADAKKGLEGAGIEVLCGAQGILEAASLPDADIVVSSVVGAAGIMPTYAAVQAGKVVALANKEALVSAGAVITAEAERRGARILPIDSEHSAVFQVLMGQDRKALRKLVLTASGGPFFGKGPGILEEVTPEMALDHPQWKMGPKVTVDSATMMNKGLEVIEAHWLFGLPGDRIEVLIHPQSIVHSMVEFIDGSILAQMGVTDMRLPIAFALGYPERMDLPFDPLDLAEARKLEFFRPDFDLFPCLGLAYDALRRGGGVPASMNAANEEAVDAFLAGRLPFKEIAGVVKAVMDRAPAIDDTDLSEVLKCDRWARQAAGEIMLSFGGAA